MAKVLKKLRMMIQDGNQSDGEKIYKEEEVKLSPGIIQGLNDDTGDAAIGVTDVRKYGNKENNFTQTPNQFPHRSARYDFGYVSGAGSDWRSMLTIKGWTEDYAAWQLIGPSSTGADDDLYFRSGISSSWRSPRKIYHEGNLPTTATRWPTWSEVTSKPTTATRWPTWSEVTSKPTTFSPSSHTHSWSEVTSKPTTFDPTLDKVYPVGAVYLSVTSTNPGTLFGGTWVAFGTGRTLVGIDTSQTEFNSVEKTGGHKDLAKHTHTATTNNTGSHTHTVSGTAANNGAHAHTGKIVYTDGHYGGNSTEVRAWSASGEATVTITNSAGGHTHTVSGTAASAGGHSHTVDIAETGTGNSGNLQPYITVYMWKRTA